MLSKQYEFTTGATETTKFLDFSNHFTITNKSFICKLYKDVGATYEECLFGTGFGINGDGLGQDANGNDIDLICPALTINESDGTFNLSKLESNITYKIVILQLD